MEEEKKENVLERTKEETEKIIKNILDKGIKTDNLDMLAKVVDIHKDISNENYWKKKEENEMIYRNRPYYEGRNYGRDRYGDDSYGRRSRDSRGRYMEGHDRNYRGYEMLDDIYGNYDMYHEGKEEYERGNYGAKEDTIKSLEYMMESVVKFVEMLKRDANNEEEMNIIKKYTRKISEM